MNLLSFWGRAAGAALLAMAAGAATAQTADFAKPEDAIAYRKGAFNVLESHFSHLNAMALGRIAFDPQAAALDADTVARLAPLPFRAFGAGTGPAPGTRANELIWTAAPRFASDRDDFLGKAARLPELARAGDIAALKKAMLDTGASCRKCHEQFRNR